MSTTKIPKEKGITNSTNFELKKKINYLYSNFYKFRSVEERVAYIKSLKSQMSIYSTNALRDDKIYTTYILQSDAIEEL